MAVDAMTAYALVQKFQGNPDYQSYVDPNDPNGWANAARQAKWMGDPNYANWQDPYADVFEPYYQEWLQSPGGMAANQPGGAPAPNPDPAQPTTPAADYGDPANWAGAINGPATATAPAAPATPERQDVATPAPAAPTGPTAEQMTAFDLLAKMLTDIGLGSLFSIGPNGEPGGWLWNQIVAGIDTESEFSIAIEQTPEFTARFPAIGAIREHNAKAANDPSMSKLQPMTAKDVLAYEKTFREQILPGSGLPAWMFDDPNEVQALIVNGLSVYDVADRLDQTWSRVYDTNPMIRQAFEQFYGVGQGDAALAAFYLDPQMTIAKLDKASKAAFTAGTGSSLGMTIDQTMAERIAEFSPTQTEAGIIEDLTTVNQLGGLLTEGITETSDLTTDTGLESVVFGNAEATQALERRLLERKANERSSFGGGILTNQGLTGVGSA